MSWKSLVSAGLLCIVASPAFAVATLGVVKAGDQAGTNGFLNAAGNWVVKAQITPTGGSAISTEIGFQETTNSDLLGATANGAVFDRNTAGLKIFGWEPDWNGDTTLSDGLRVNAGADQVFSALGSNILAGTAARDYVTFEIQGPAFPSRLTTTIQWLGEYGAGNAQGSIGEVVTPPGAFSFVSGSQSFTAKAGDANLDNSVDSVDFTIWLSKIGVPAGQATWYNGDFNDDNSIDSTDFTIWLSHIGTGAGGIAIPEPASFALVGLGSLFVGSLRVRKREV